MDRRTISNPPRRPTILRRGREKTGGPVDTCVRQHIGIDMLVCLCRNLFAGNHGLIRRHLIIDGLDGVVEIALLIDLEWVDVVGAIEATLWRPWVRSLADPGCCQMVPPPEQLWDRTVTDQTTSLWG